MGHFEQLLESIVANPEARISELQLLSPAEERQLLHEFNDTSRVPTRRLPAPVHRAAGGAHRSRWHWSSRKRRSATES